MVGDASRHRGSPRVGVLQALVRPGEVVVLEMQGDGQSVVVSIFFENAVVSLVNRRIPIRIVRFCRST